MNDMAFRDFEAAARFQGFDEVLERDRPSVTVFDCRSHPFHAWARLTHREMRPMARAETSRLRADNTLGLDCDALQAKNYGREVRSVWVTRRDG